MRYFKLFFKLIFLIFIANAVQAQTEQPVNPDLQFNGKPLDAMAIGRMTMGDASRKDPIDLHQYTPELQQIVIQESLDKPKENKIGYSFKYKAYNLESQHPSYDVYKVIADLGKHRYLLLIESGGGGSGEFTSLLVMERTGDFIQNVQEIAGGDRANGGIVSVDYVDGKITVVQQATPFSVFSHALSLTDPNNPILHYDDPYNNLVDRANCRAGEVTTTGKLDEKLATVSLTLYSESPCNGDIAKPGTLQAVYENTVSEYRKKGKTVLNEADMIAFAKEIMDNFKKTAE